jgi:septum formation protein
MTTAASPPIGPTDGTPDAPDSREVQEAVEIVLASASPRRHELLQRAGIPYIAMPADIDETAEAGEPPEQLVLRLARQKARKIADTLAAIPRRLVLGADTIVVLDEVVYGKPRDIEDAFRLLSELTGRTHRVITGIAVVESKGLKSWERTVESCVTLRSAGAAELRSYLATGESLDKAGAYAIQGEGRNLVSQLEGSETNVIGLPLEETVALLREAGARLGARS